MDARKLDALQKVLGHVFPDPDLLTQALTHPSVVQGRAARRAAPYERLEFLGDRVVGLVVAEMLFQRFPDEPEGALARRHAALVRKESMAVVAERIGLPDCLILAKGEDDSGGRANPAILADACEALAGALYASAGFEIAARFVRSVWTDLLEADAAPPKDAKTALQEWAQGRGLPLPVYAETGREGPPHEPVFVISVTVSGLAPATGTGTSKRAAQQAAASAMLEKVRNK